MGGGTALCVGGTAGNPSSGLSTEPGPRQHLVGAGLRSPRPGVLFLHLLQPHQGVFDPVIRVAPDSLVLGTQQLLDFFPVQGPWARLTGGPIWGGNGADRVPDGDRPYPRPLLAALQGPRGQPRPQDSSKRPRRDPAT